MSLYVYAIAAAPISLDGLHGAGGEPLRMVTSSNAASHAIAGDITTPPLLNADALRAQDALVRELAARADALLPSRFGSVFVDERTLRQTLDELAPRLERALTRIRGCEQMTIRLFHDGPLTSAGTPPAIAVDVDVDVEMKGEAEVGPGTRYMRQRAAEARQLPAVVDALRAPLSGVIRDERVDRGQPTPSGPMVSPVIGSIHHLIPRGAAETYRARLEEAAASPEFAATGIRLRVSGPSPAYAFAEGELS